MTTKQQLLKKPNPEIGFCITAGAMTFLGRKIYNALVYRAQQLGFSGKGKLPLPIHYDISKHINIEKYWWMPLNNIISDASTGARKHEMVKKYLRGLMGVVVERNVIGWEASHIISNVRMIGTRHPAGGGKGDTLLVGWQFPEELEEKILEPDQYTRLSLYFQSVLKTESALVLYEICKRYSTNPGRVTPRLDWLEWQSRLTSDKVRPEYKYFKRDFILPAIKEVCARTDIDVELIEHRAAKRGSPVESVQFSVQRKAQSELELTPAPAVPYELMSAMEEMGVSTMQAEKFLAQYGEDRIKAAIELTITRVSNIRLPSLNSPAAYFKKAMAEDFASGSKKALAAKEKAEKEGIAAAAQIKALSDQSVTPPVAPVAGCNDPEGAWAAFRQTPDALFFKTKLAKSYDAAPKLQQVAFARFLAARE